MFSIANPDVIYKYRLPVQSNFTKVSDPVSFMVDVFNLISHPFQDDAETGENNDVYKRISRKYIDNQLMLVI